MKDGCYTTTECAKELNLSPNMVLVLCKAGKINGERRGGRWYISRKAIEDYKIIRRLTVCKGKKHMRPIRKAKIEATKNEVVINPVEVIKDYFSTL